MEIEWSGTSCLTVGGKGDVIGTDLSEDDW